jgi:hypothetical protein
LISLTSPFIRIRFVLHVLPLARTIGEQDVSKQELFNVIIIQNFPEAEENYPKYESGILNAS